MKHQNAKMLTAIKSFSIFFFIVLLCFLSVAMKTKKIAEDLWQQLGISQFQAHQDINQSFIYERLSYLGAKNAKNIVAGNRVAMVNELAAYAKKYIAGEEFRREYENFRNRNKPDEPYLYKISTDSIKAIEKERIEKAMKQAELNLNSTNTKLKNGAPYQIENLKKELKALDDPNNRVIKMRLDNAQHSNDASLKLYNDKLLKLETEYPADPQQLLKKRLQKILDITADVDYTAELKDAGRYKVFVNPAYEAKPKEWKLAFRAGKPATDAVRKIAQDWLKQLN